MFRSAECTFRSGEYTFRIAEYTFHSAEHRTRAVFGYPQKRHPGKSETAVIQQSPLLFLSHTQEHCG